MGQCLSTNALKIYISWIAIAKPTLGAVYHRYTTKDEYSCIGTSSDTCYLHCTTTSHSATFNCNNAGTCFFCCESERGAKNATINGNNAAQLILKGDASFCLQEVTVNAPTNGDLIFNRMTGYQAYILMEVNAGTNTGSIYIDCTYPDMFGCYRMQVNAQSAQFLKLVIDDVFDPYESSDIRSQFRGESSELPARIYCPRNSYYNGPEAAPCVIENNGEMWYVDIDAYYGTPRDLVINGSGIIGLTNLICYDGSTSTTDFSPSSACYITHAPTRAPTNDPTLAPTINPTLSPTFKPTSAPTFKPTANPTFKPTTNPTFNPTLDPTLSPIIQPTDNPTMIPSISPTKPSTTMPSVAPIKNPTKTKTTSYDDEEDDFTSIQYERLANLGMIHRWIFGCFILGIIALSLFAWMDAKCIPSRKNDYVQVTLIVGISLQTMDMFSDCFFAVNMVFWSRINPKYTVVLISSIVFVVVPCACAMVQLLHHLKKHWFQSSDKVRGWLNSRSNTLYFASIITGSSFAAVSICNSYMFQLDIFDMGLSKKEIQAFMYKRYSVVFLENIPQLGIQIYFIYSLGTLDDLATISSIIFSFLSIIISILSTCTQRSITRAQGTVSISMKVTGSAVMEHASNCKRMKRKLIKELSILVGVTSSITDILKPVHIKQGFQISVQFTVAESDQDFYSTLMEAQASGELQDIFKRAWCLSDCPQVDDLKQTVVQSKRERLDSESLSDGKEEKMDVAQANVDITMVEVKDGRAGENATWKCSICTYSNYSSLNQCEICNNPRMTKR